MTAVDDLIAFVRQQLDEDERVARQMIEGSPTSSGFYIEQETEATDLMAVGAHVYRWSPARVLAKVKADRRILDLVFGYEATIDGEWGCCHTADQIAAGQCPETRPAEVDAIRAMAQPYAGRPGWREEWAV